MTLPESPELRRPTLIHGRGRSNPDYAFLRRRGIRPVPAYGATEAPECGTSAPAR